MPEPSLPFRRRDRTPIYQGIARLIWAQYCLENDIVRTPFEHAPADFKLALLDQAEAMANMALSPDLRDTALMCMADDLLRGASQNSLTISEASKQMKKSYLLSAESALQAFLLNLKTQPFDPAYRESMCRELDGIAPKEPERHEQVHPLIRGIVNDVAAAHGIPAPKGGSR